MSPKSSKPVAASVGKNPARSDGPDKVTGRALYVDDLKIDGLWHGATLRSPHARARLLSIDTSFLEGRDDVCVVTAKDVPAPNRLKLIEDDWPVLVEEIAEHVGEAVALVAAPTRAAALAALSQLKCDWEPLDAVTTIDQALVGDARRPAGSEEGGGPLILARCDLDHGDIDAGFAAASRVIDNTFETGHQEHMYIEPQGIIATWHDAGPVKLEVIGSLQCPYYIHKAVGELFQIGGEAFRVRQTITGGGFGGKEDYPDMIATHAALLARAANRPVKIVYDRHEDIVATTKRHPSRIRHRTGVDENGKLLAIEIDLLLDGGAYTTLSPVVLSRAVLHAAGPYTCPNVRIQGRVVATNTATNGAFRGFGAPQSQFAAERQMDAIARALDIDPLTLRESNAYTLRDITPTQQVLTEGVSAEECLRIAEERTNFRALHQSYEEARERRMKGLESDSGPLRGIGISLFWHGSGFTGNGERMMRSPAKIDLQPGGRVRVLVSSTDFGQGTEIVLPQIVADAVGIPITQVDFVRADTALVPDSGPTVASRTVMIVGGLLERAGQSLKTRLLEWVNAKRTAEDESATPASDLKGGLFVDAEGEGVALYTEIAEAYLAEHSEVAIVEHFEGDDTTFDESTYRGTAYSSYGWGCNVVEIEVCPDTLSVKPTKLFMVCDVGKAIHPTLCKGQIEGGTLQAVAWGYLEEIQLRDGHYLNSRMQNCLVPTALDVPAMETVLVENPAPTGPFGAKGVGELPMDGGAPAILAAIENATGAACASLPATPEKIVRELSKMETLAALVEGAPSS